MGRKKIKPVLLASCVLTMLACGVSAPPRKACEKSDDCDDGQICIDEICVAGTIPSIPDDDEPAETQDSGQTPPDEVIDAGQPPATVDAGQAPSILDAGNGQTPMDAGPEIPYCQQPDNISADCDDGDACTLNDQCSNGICAGEALYCESPPEAYCSDSDTLITYQSDGLCQSGSCTYPASSQICTEGCANNACNPLVQIRLQLKTHPSILMGSGANTIRARIAPTLRGQMGSTSWGLTIQAHPH